MNDYQSHVKKNVENICEAVTKSTGLDLKKQIDDMNKTNQAFHKKIHKINQDFTKKIHSGFLGPSSILNSNSTMQATQGVNFLTNTISNIVAGGNYDKVQSEENQAERISEIRKDECEQNDLKFFDKISSSRIKTEQSLEKTVSRLTEKIPTDMLQIGSTNIMDQKIRADLMSDAYDSEIFDIFEQESKKGSKCESNSLVRANNIKSIASDSNKVKLYSGFKNSTNSEVVSPKKYTNTSPDTTRRISRCEAKKINPKERDGPCTPKMSPELVRRQSL